MDSKMIQKLCETLDDHLARYQELVDYVAQEKKYLLEHDLDGLFTSSKKKEELALDIQNNINVLIDGINETALMLGLPLTPQPLLADLARRLPKPFDNRVNDGAIKLERLKNIILRENEANRHFVEEAIRMVNESVNILTGAKQLKGEGYSKNSGQGETKRSLPVKLSKAV